MVIAIIGGEGQVIFYMFIVVQHAFVCSGSMLFFCVRTFRCDMLQIVMIKYNMPVFNYGREIIT